MSRLFLLFSLLALLPHVVLAQFENGANAFISPPPASTATNDYSTNVIYVYGESAFFEWATDYLTYDVVLVHPYAGGANTSVLSSMSSSNNGSAPEINTYIWSIGGIGDIATYPMFYCQLVPTSGTQLANIVSHNFNISDGQPTYTTTVIRKTTTVAGIASIIVSTSIGVVLPASPTAVASTSALPQTNQASSTVTGMTMSTPATQLSSPSTVQASSTNQSPSSTAIGTPVTAIDTGLTTGAKIGLAVGITFGVIALALLGYFVWLYRRRHAHATAGSAVKYEAVDRPELSSTAQRPMYHEAPGPHTHTHELYEHPRSEQLYAGQQMQTQMQDHGYAGEHESTPHQLYDERGRHELSGEHKPWHNTSH